MRSVGHAQETTGLRLLPEQRQLGQSSRESMSAKNVADGPVARQKGQRARLAEAAWRRDQRR